MVATQWTVESTDFTHGFIPNITIKMPHIRSTYDIVCKKSCTNMLDTYIISSLDIFRFIIDKVISTWNRLTKLKKSVANNVLLGKKQVTHDIVTNVKYVSWFYQFENG